MSPVIDTLLADLADVSPVQADELDPVPATCT
jgi:hypothetical protein